MNAKKPRCEEHRAATGSGLKLYIYYLKGRLDPGTRFEAGRFLGNWEEDEFSFLFFSEPSTPAVETLAAVQPQLELLDQFQMTYAEWLGEEPRIFQAGGLWIVPPWLADDRVVSRPHILLDPGLVFGTGTHPTTHDCLHALQYLFDRLHPTTTLDLGTGTGLLALAAAALGSRWTLAVDLNALAVETAQRNICRNQMEDRVLALRARAEFGIEMSADLVVANIHHDVMVELLTRPGFLQKRWCILSGLMTGEVRDIIARLDRMPVRLWRRWSRDGIWHTLLGEILQE
jgi:ribosomal protein L11 methyltransferase